MWSQEVHGLVVEMRTEALSVEEDMPDSNYLRMLRGHKWLFMVRSKFTHGVKGMQ